jgi:hypothetical protein
MDQSLCGPGCRESLRFLRYALDEEERRCPPGRYNLRGLARSAVGIDGTLGRSISIGIVLDLG